MKFTSWGQYPKANHKAIQTMHWRSDSLPTATHGRSRLAYGRGASQGDSCLNNHGELLNTSHLNHFISFDTKQGVIKAEAGVTLEEILKIIVPHGFFLPVTPGTKFVTLGGAIANDVHGKNHHKAGTFGRYIKRFELLRSDEQRLECSPAEEKELYQATIGGLGLTGLITWAELQLIPITSSYIDVETIRMNSLGDFFRLAPESDKDFDYTVAWIDCSARGHALGRGLFMRGNHVKEAGPLATGRQQRLTLPFDFPTWVINPASIKIFDTFWYQKQMSARKHARQHYDPFFYPLDGIGAWNRAYGKRGFFQYQCVIPHKDQEQVLKRLLELITNSKMASFLSTMKFFGDIISPGMMSFPRPGVTLAVDFANNGPRTLSLFKKLDNVVRAAGGAIYPAKDARMSAEDFATFYPRIGEFKKYIDPAFSSSFWQRVTDI